MNWRLRVIVISTLVAVAATAFIYFFIPAATQIDHFWGSVFVSWVGGVLLFLVVGGAVALASIVNPDDEALERRLSILLKNKSGAVADHARLQIKSALKPYFESHSVVLTIIQHDAANHRYLCEYRVTGRMKALVPDLSPTLETRIGWQKGSVALQGAQRNRLDYLKIEGLQLKQNVEFDDSFLEPIAIDLSASKPKSIDYQFTLWITGGSEQNTASSVRYLERVTVTVTNKLAVSVPINYSVQSGGTQSSSVPSAATLKLGEATAVPPGTEYARYVIG